jgi:predicted O-methyltransferase YrrM
LKAGADRILRTEQAHYLDGLVRPRDALLRRLEADAQAQRQPISDPEVAQLLHILCAMHRPQQLVEVGCNIGYGAIVLGRAMGPNARLSTVEHSAPLADMARANVAEAGLADRVTVVTQDAIAFLRERQSPVDFAYIDCVKEDYPAYLELLAPHMGPGAVLVADNVLWRGLVAHTEVPADELPRVEALRAFNARIAAAPWDGVVLPLGDGVAVAVRRA